MMAVPPTAQAHWDAGARGGGPYRPQEVEILSTLDWWKRLGDDVLRTCIERYQAHRL
jgi:hypothetical protein